jgi:hypothetical protein
MEDTTKTRKPQAPELRTVYYSFHESLSANSALPDDRVGLTRRELDFETPDELDEAALSGFADVSLDEEVPVVGESGVVAKSTFEQLMEVGMDNSVIWVPEVVALQFRYFDGSSWRSSWDSLARGGLPVAVEMTMAVAALDDADKIRNAASAMVAGMGTDGTLGQGALSDGGLLTEEASIDLSAQVNVPEPRVHRIVIHVPNSPLIKERKPVKRRAAPTLAAPTALPKVIIQRARPKSKTQQISPDQWMRNE